MHGDLLKGRLPSGPHDRPFEALHGIVSRNADRSPTRRCKSQASLRESQRVRPGRSGNKKQSMFRLWDFSKDFRAMNLLDSFNMWNQRQDPSTIFHDLPSSHPFSKRSKHLRQLGCEGLQHEFSCCGTAVAMEIRAEGSCSTTNRLHQVGWEVLWPALFWWPCLS